MTELTPEVLADLRKKAEAAPKTPWVYVPDDDAGGWMKFGTDLASGNPTTGYDGQWRREFCEYAIAANPSVVLALLDALHEARAAYLRVHGQLQIACDERSALRQRVKALEEEIACRDDAALERSEKEEP